MNGQKRERDTTQMPRYGRHIDEANSQNSGQGTILNNATEI